MPYKFENTTLIPRDMKRSVKLTLKEREEIKELYGVVSQRVLAKIYNVSRKTITYIGDPEQLRKNLLARDLRGGSKRYYTKEKQKEYMKNYRKNKLKLYKKNKLIQKNVNSVLVLNQ